MPRLHAALLVALLATPAGAQAPAPVRAVVDRAITSMGGDSTIRAIRTLRLEVMTSWLRTSMADRPFLDYPSYERNTELRDYTTNSWRNTRAPVGAGPSNPFPLIVRDTVATFRAPTGPNSPPEWRPLNIAYVDDRRQLFGFAPERLVFTLRDDPKARLLTDTLIDRTPHARVQAVVDGYPAVTFFRRRDGLPIMVRFLADEINDFGLAQWGKHEVEFWYSGWTAFSREAGAPILPRQRDVMRVGQPYKRMTILSAVINAPAPADSFAITDSLVTAYLTGPSAKAMWDITADVVDSATKLSADGNFVTAFHPALGTAGAVKIGGRWVLLESGVGPGVPEKVAAWAARKTPGTPLGGVFAATQANGGLPWMIGRKHTVVASAGIRGMLPSILHGSIPTSVTVVTSPQWIRIGTDSVWVEPLAGSDFEGGMAIYSPTLQWLNFPAATTPAGRSEQDAVIARLSARKLPVTWIGGSGRGVAVPYTAPAR